MTDPRSLPSMAALRAFEAAARHMSFKEAARELNLTQSAVSHQISGLEALLGATLFRRNNRVIGLTERGVEYRDEVAAILEHLAAATARVRVAANAQALVIAAPPNFAAHWLVPRLPAFRVHHPKIEPSVVTLDGEADLKDDGLDVAIRYGAETDDSGRGDVVFTETIIPVCAPGLASAIQEPADLFAQTLLHNSFHPGEWGLWFAAAGLEAEGPLPGPSFHTSDLVHRAALAGLGVAMGRRPQVDEYRAAGTLISPVDLLVPTDRHYRVIYRRRRGNGRKVDAFRGWLLDEAEPVPPAR